jgi:hypothetical protein
MHHVNTRSYSKVLTHGTLAATAYRKYNREMHTDCQLEAWANKVKV